MTAIIKKKSWLKSVIEISEGNKQITLTYNGRGIGYETVSIQGEEYTEQKAVAILWFVPKFELEYEEQKYLIQIDVSFRLTIKSLLIQRNGRVIYCEEN